MHCWTAKLYGRAQSFTSRPDSPQRRRGTIRRLIHWVAGMAGCLKKKLMAEFPSPSPKENFPHARISALHQTVFCISAVSQSKMRSWNRVDEYSCRLCWSGALFNISYASTEQRSSQCPPRGCQGMSSFFYTELRRQWHRLN